LVRGLLTTPNAIVESIDPKAMPMMAVTNEERLEACQETKQRACNGRFPVIDSRL